MTEAPIRCQILLMRLARYTPHAVYVPGKYLVLADNLSRNPQCVDETSKEQEFTAEIEAHVSYTIEKFKISADQLNKLKREVRNDVVLQQVISYTRNGWPSEAIAEQVKSYFSEQSNLSVTEDDLLLYQHRLVIPKTIQRQMLQRIHDDGHMSIHKCRKRASQSVW